MQRKTVLILIVLLTFLLSPRMVMAATYYVAANGSDSNDGSADHPFRTIQKAADTVVPGDTVKVRPGVYYEQIEIEKSGLQEKPITFEGVRGVNGQWLTIVDGGLTVKGWVPAPEVAPGVYKTTALPFEPHCMVVEDNGIVKDIPRLNNSSNASSQGFIYLAKSPEETSIPPAYGKAVNFWDGIEAMYYYVDGTTYIRFRNRDNPNDKIIRASTGTGVRSGFRILGQSYIHIKNLTIRCVFRGITLARPEAHHIVIEGNRIVATGREKIYIENGAHDIDIQKNEMGMSGLSPAKPGAWGKETYDEADYQLGVKEHIYQTYKYVLSKSETSSDEDCGITIASSGPNIRIFDNELLQSLVGISLRGDSKIYIYRNKIHNMSSTAIYFGPGASAEVHDNLVYDCNINFRFGTVEDASNDRTVCVYNNKCFNPKGVGNHLYFHFASSKSTPVNFAKFYFYHNSFAGGRFVFALSKYVTGNGGLKKTRFINNVFSSESIYGFGGKAFYDDETMVEVFDYNWLGGDYLYGYPPSWAKKNNIFANGKFAWDNSQLPDFTLAENSTAHHAGIDLSTVYIIDGTAYSQAPGLVRKYYSQDAPDMGYIPDLTGHLLIPPESLRCQDGMVQSSVDALK